MCEINHFFFFLNSDEIQPEKIGLHDLTNGITTTTPSVTGETSKADLGLESVKKAHKDNPFVSSWKRWASETTLHGVKVISDRNESKLKRILRLVFLAAFLGLLAFICYDQTDRYLQYNTVTKETIVFEKEMEFPAVTLCNHEIIHAATKLEPRDEQALRYMYSWPRDEDNSWILDDVKGSIRVLLDRDTLKVSDILSLCYFGRNKVDCSEEFRELRTEYGKCFTFNSNYTNNRYTSSIVGSEYGFSFEGHVNQGLFKLSHDGSVGFKLLVHPRYEHPDMTKAMTLSPGFTHYIAISKHENVYLPRPVQAFDMEECVETDSPGFISPLKFFRPYSTSMCLQECQMIYVNSTCGCIGPFFNPTESQSETTVSQSRESGVTVDLFPECTPKDYITCHEDAIATFSSRNLVQQCYCPIPCKTANYETRTSMAMYPSLLTVTDKYPKTELDDIRQNYLQVRIYFDNKIVTTNTQMLEYELADLLGSYGGYLGLALGASMLTLLELLEQTIVSCLECCNNRNKIKPDI